MSSNEQSGDGANADPQNKEMEISMVAEVVEEAVSEAVSAELEQDRDVW